MTPSRPYLLRALREWVLDNGQTPFVLVDPKFPGTDVPNEFIVDGRMVLNIGNDAVVGLEISNDALSFEARFNGRSRHIFAPLGAVLAIYSRETGRGMVFDDEQDLSDAEATAVDDEVEQAKPKRPHLKLVE